METFCIVDKNTGNVLTSFEVMMSQRDYDDSVIHDATLLWETIDNVDVYLEVIHSDLANDLQETVNMLSKFAFSYM